MPGQVTLTNGAPVAGWWTRATVRSFSTGPMPQSSVEPWRTCPMLVASPSATTLVQWAGSRK